MFQSLELTRMAQALSQNAGSRLELIARNVANADTPGYRALDIPDFADTYQADGAKIALRQTRQGHVAATLALPYSEGLRPIGGPGMNGNSVTIETEMVKATEARQENDMALAIYRSSGEILRACLGRSK